ncbi:unnamed protein product [Soboliphyme baturini]|uniref:Uncharacterized protein n=1 Tax=Soboliphyme baturini TaxID=241478 RepID=A0A183IHU2_9BILA|nr:unnamed protein product [Soboliphyme baturini]
MSQSVGQSSAVNDDHESQWPEKLVSGVWRQLKSRGEQEERPTGCSPAGNKGENGAGRRQRTTTSTTPEPGTQPAGCSVLLPAPTASKANVIGAAASMVVMWTAAPSHARPPAGR